MKTSSFQRQREEEMAECDYTGDHSDITPELGITTKYIDIMT